MLKAIAMAFITEDWLREKFTLSEGSELRLPADCKLTPSARELIKTRRLVVKFQDQQGRLYVEDAADHAASNNQPKMKAVHGLTSKAQSEIARCELCTQPITKKSDTMTHLNAHTLVAKNDPRLAFRASLDTSIALAVWLQTEFKEKTISAWLSDVRSVLGNVMRADALGEELIAQQIAEMTEDEIHQISHNPLKYLGHDHLVPDQVFGREVALLNILRTKIRETEIAAANIYIDRYFNILRSDIMQALNRLSSAVYVLMVMLTSEAGIKSSAQLKSHISRRNENAH